METEEWKSNLEESRIEVNVKYVRAAYWVKDVQGHTYCNMHTEGGGGGRGTAGNNR